MRIARLVVASALVSALAACTGAHPASPTSPSSAPRDDVLVLGTGSGPIVVDAANGSVVARDAGALASPDGSRLYTTSTSEGSTTIVTSDAISGRRLATTSIEGTLDTRVVSVSGRRAALMHPLPAGGDPWIPVPRSSTSITVVDPTGGSSRKTYELAGNFEPEAFSIDDRRLFLIEYLPAEAPTAYRVTFLDLATGSVQPVFGRFNAPPERMPGIRLRQLFDPVTSQLYTLYSTEPSKAVQNYWNGGYQEGQDLTFVHVLSLREGWAYCAGLPRRLWGEPAGAQAMVTSPDGRGLYIVDPIRGVISRMDTRTLKITQTRRVDLGPDPAARSSASMSADGSTLYVGSAGEDAVFALDTQTMRVLDRWSMPAGVSDLALSADGARLYAATSDQVVVVDAASGASLGTIPAVGVQSILHIGSPSP
jgi:hypothetical protein